MVPLKEVARPKLTGASTVKDTQDEDKKDSGSRGAWCPC
jgi:hypothetical protein